METGKPETEQVEDRSLQPVDLVGVVEHANTLTSELEKAWSEVLADATDPGARHDLRTRWAVALEALTGEVSAREQRLIEKGIDPYLYKWPIDQQDAAVAKFEPQDEHSRRLQQESAQLLSILALAEAIEPLTGPQPDSEPDEDAVWWTAGAFALVRQHAALVLLLTRELERVDADASTPQTVEAETMRSRAFEALEAAHEAMTHADPEAAILHCLKAARTRFASLVLDGGIIVQFRSVASCGEVPIQMLAMAEELLERLAGGQEVDPGFPSLLANGLLPAVSELVREPPVDQIASIAAGISPSD